MSVLVTEAQLEALADAVASQVAALRDDVREATRITNLILAVTNLGLLSGHGARGGLLPSASVRFSPSAAGAVMTLPFAVLATDLLELSLNGVRQFPGLDYQLTNATTVTFGFIVTPDDTITARKLGVSFTDAGLLADYLDAARLVQTSQRFQPPSAAALQPLPFSVAPGEMLEIYVGGVRQWPGLDYQLTSTNAVTFGFIVTPDDTLTAVKTTLSFS